MSRSQYLLGKVLFNVFIGALQSAITVVLAAIVLGRAPPPRRGARRGGGARCRAAGWARRAGAATVGTAGWFFFYAIFALRIRRNDAFNTVTSVFYFVFLFASSMFYPRDPLPAWRRAVALANPITWHVDVRRYATIGLGHPPTLAWQS